MSRVRSKGAFTDYGYRQTITNVGCTTSGAQQVSENGPGWCPIGEVKTTTDVVTPNYVRRRSRGEVIINPFETVTIKRDCTLDGPSAAYKCSTGGPYTMVCERAYFGAALAGAKAVMPTFPSLFSPEELLNAKEIAATKCWAAINKEETQTLVFLAELGQTISLLRNPLRSIQSFLSKVRSDKEKNASAALRSLTVGQYLAKEWLTYRYGWSQLYRDVYSTLKALEKDERTGLLNAIGHYRMEKENTESLVIDSSPFRVYANRTTIEKISVKCGVFYKGSRSTKDYLGLTPEALLETAWEVIPYSFVVDWVVGVQSYLKGLIAQLSTPVLGSYTTVRQTFIKTAYPTSTVARPADAANWNVTGDVRGTISVSMYKTTRTPGILPPALKFDLKIQDFLDIRVLDSLALIANILGRR